VDSDWDRFASRCQQALGHLVEGPPEPFKALWSRADDVVIMADERARKDEQQW
jgi:hypothetical protein